MPTGISHVPNPLAVPALAKTGQSGAVSERARQEVAALYTSRAGEFLNYALALGRNEELARDALQEAFLRYFAPSAPVSASLRLGPGFIA